MNVAQREAFPLSGIIFSCQVSLSCRCCCIKIKIITIPIFDIIIKEREKKVKKWIKFCQKIIVLNRLFCNLDEFFCCLRHIMTFVVADCENTVRLRVIEGIKIHGHSVFCVLGQFPVARDKHLRVEGDSHSLERKRENGLDVFRLKDNIRGDLCLLKHLICKGAHAVSLVD